MKLNNQLKRNDIWFSNSRIRVHKLKSKHVTFKLRKGDCPPVNNIKLPHETKAVYLGIHLDRRLTWRNHIEAKNVQIKLSWLIGTHSKLSLDNKVTLYTIKVFVNQYGHMVFNCMDG